METKNREVTCLPIFKLFRISVFSDLIATLKLAPRNLYARCYVGIWLICLALTSLLTVQFIFKPMDYFLIAEAFTVAVVCCTLYLILKSVFADLLGVFAKSDFKSCFLHATGMVLYYRSKVSAVTYSFNTVDIETITEYSDLGVIKISVKNVTQCMNDTSEVLDSFEFDIPMKLTSMSYFKQYLVSNVQKYTTISESSSTKPADELSKES